MLSWEYQIPESSTGNDQTLNPALSRQLSPLADRTSHQSVESDTSPPAAVPPSGDIHHLNGGGGGSRPGRGLDRRQKLLENAPGRVDLRRRLEEEDDYRAGIEEQEHSTSRTRMQDMRSSCCALPLPHDDGSRMDFSLLPLDA
ncbi:hypothetical protein KSP39_PZI007312 [Platanthera zijinensis]|uniref:Uncharacterized protein n=1 Tax=Platanthera zijinensis TaxID=2320716 RepID=A0AAP0BRF9_9ASPA